MLNKTGKYFFVSIIISFIAANLIAADIRYTKAYGRSYVYLPDVAKYYGMSYSSNKDKATLLSKYSSLNFTDDKKACYINGIKVDLLFPVINHKSRHCISSMDFFKTIDPVLRHWALDKDEPRTIVIDPGHGGKDKGASGRRFHEKNIVLAISQKVAKLLKHIGYKVYLTRNSDVFPSLKKRPAMARQKGADIFISIHANKAASKSVSGIECFAMTPAGAASTYSKKPSYSSFPGNKNNANNIALCYWIQRSLIKKTKADDRGVRRARFMVLKEASCPSVLIETGFLSNTKEERLLGTEAYQWKIARGIVQGILLYHYQLKRKK